MRVNNRSLSRVEESVSHRTESVLFPAIHLYFPPPLRLRVISLLHTQRAARIVRDGIQTPTLARH